MCVCVRWLHWGRFDCRISSMILWFFVCTNVPYLYIVTMFSSLHSPTFPRLLVWLRSLQSRGRFPFPWRRLSVREEPLKMLPCWPTWRRWRTTSLRHRGFLTCLGVQQWTWSLQSFPTPSVRAPVGGGEVLHESSRWSLCGGDYCKMKLKLGWK